MCSTFACHTFGDGKCCSPQVWKPIYNQNVRLSWPQKLSIYGEGPIELSLTVEWSTDSSYHYPSDVQAYIQTNVSESDEDPSLQSLPHGPVIHTVIPEPTIVVWPALTYTSMRGKISLDNALHFAGY